MNQVANGSIQLPPGMQARAQGAAAAASQGQ